VLGPSLDRIAPVDEPGGLAAPGHEAMDFAETDLRGRASKPASKFIDGAPRLAAGVREVNGIDSFLSSFLLLLFETRN